jgi:hypothetical protein
MKAKKRKTKKGAQPKTAKKKTARRFPAPKKSNAKKASRKSRRGAARAYSQPTIKVLFTLSGNQCAFPGCTNEIVAAETQWSDAAVVGHICHIYAAADNGPRGKPDLTTKERNSPGNLILMCGHHHPLIDKQWETYPATQLKEWKKAHETKATPGTAEAIRAETHISKHAFFEAKSDEEIEKALARIRGARNLAGFPAVDEAQILATQVEQSLYSSGSTETRARALAWCARLLARGNTLGRAEDLLHKSRELAVTAEAALAQAFITAANDTPAALQALAKIKTPAARSAAIRMLTHNQGAKKAIAWVTASGLRVDDFDAEGKFALLFALLDAGEWDAARAAVDATTDSDLNECPGLLHTVALARLLTAIPAENRAIAFMQIPLEVNTFQLASTPAALAERRVARHLFTRLSNYARDVGADLASKLSSDYALWLGLRDPGTHEAAMSELRDSMSDPATSLRRVNLAIRFGMTVDLAAIDLQIDQSVALSGKGSADDAMARFYLVFTKDPKAAAEYIEKHRAQLYEYLPKPTIMGFEVEFLARAGLIGTARTRLAEAAEAGMSARDQDLLGSILAELSGGDPITERRTLYEASGDLRVLTALVDALEKAQLWQDLLPYLEKLFGASPSVETYERIVGCLNHLNRTDCLLQSMSAQPSLVDQSEYLKSVWAWTLYQEGRFSEATAALQRLSNPEEPNARSLRINIAVASGAWDELLEFCQQTWNDRDRHSASELMHAAQISQAVNGPHSKDLVIAAAEKAPTDPKILATAYFQATSAGWEQSPAVAAWLHAAAQLSGDEGPLKTVSMQEIFEQKPEWDRQASSVWELLRQGKIPTFAAGPVLHRSLLEFYLLPSLANPSEVDVRKRSVIFAYSGARPPVTIPQPKTLAIDLAAVVTFARLGILQQVLTHYQVIIPHSTLVWLFQERQQATFHQPSRIKDAAALKTLIGNGTLRVIDLAASADHKLSRQVGVDFAAMLSSARAKTATGAKTLVVRSAPIPRLGSMLGEEADIAGYEAYICSCSAVIHRLANKAAITHAEEQKARDYLRLHERPWPNEPTIPDDTELYLDGLSVSYLQTTGVLGKLKPAGVKTFIAQSEEREATALLEIQTLGAQQLDYIEHIRGTLAAGLKSGRIRAARATQLADDDQLFRLHPSYAALGLVAEADAIVVDDRFVNQHTAMTQGATSCPLLCSLDVLDLLRSARALPVYDLYTHRTTLRQAGYQLIPVAIDELVYHINQARIDQGILQESAELRAIRESLSRARMSALVQLPTEMAFLHQSLSVHIGAIKATWETVSDRADAQARADYLLQQVDVRQWAPSAAANARGLALYAYASYALKLTSPPLNSDASLKSAYFDWITDRLLKPIKEYQPEVYEWIIARSRELVVHAAEKIARAYRAAK